MKRFFALAVACIALSACDHIGGPSKVAHGQLYQMGDARYDGFFQQVHEQQVAASSRKEDRKNAHKSLAGALDLTPDASDDTILKAVKERKDKSSTIVEAPIDEAIRMDLERARRLRAIAARCEQLRETGRSLADEQKKEFENRGAEKADDKKTDKRLQVRREIEAANDALDDIARDSRHEAKRTDEFVDDLAKRIGKEVIHEQPEQAAPPPPPVKPAEKKEPAKPAKPSTPKPASPPAKPAPPTKPDAPTPPPKQPDEVFNP